MTPGTLIDVYSFYDGSDISLSGSSSGTSNGGSGISSTKGSVQSPSPSEQPFTPLGPTTTDQPSPATPAPTYSASGPTTVVPQAVSTITVTLWTTVTSYTTVYPGGPLQTTVLSMPAGTTVVTGGLFTSSVGVVTVTSTCDDGSVSTSLLPGIVDNPYVSELGELEVEGGTTRSVLAAVVPVETAAAGKVRRSEGFGPSLVMSPGDWSATVVSANGQLTTAVPALDGLVNGTGWVMTASGSQPINAPATPSQFPVTAEAVRAGVGWQDSMMALVLAVIFGALWL